MVRATYQTRLSAIILGIRPTVAQIYGTTGRSPADNLTHLAIDAWRAGLRQLHTEMSAAAELSGSEDWIHRWVASELDRENDRWHDASTLLELLAVSLGPASPDPTLGPRGRLFWNQWQRNLAHYLTMIGTGAAAASHDTGELLEHCLRLTRDHDAPRSVLDDLAAVEHAIGPLTVEASSFRPLTSAVERLQLSAIMASSFDESPACTAAIARLLEERPPPPPCHTDANRRHRMRGLRYGAAAPGR